jgi:hypothetical protein
VARTRAKRWVNKSSRKPFIQNIIANANEIVFKYMIKINKLDICIVCCDTPLIKAECRDVILDSL